MNWLTDLFAARPQLSEAQAARLAAWRALPAADATLPLAQGRVVVVDVETSGLNIARDRLIAIGAVAVVNGRIALADALSTAELLLALRPRLKERDADSFSGLRDMEREWRRQTHPT